MRRVLAVTVLSVFALALTGLHAQTAGKPVALTPDDYAAIYQLYALYPYSFDGHGSTPTAAKWGDVFTVDGVHVNATGGEFFKGRDMLNSFAGGKLRMERGAPGRPALLWLDLARSNNKNEFNVGHFITNILLEAQPDGSVKSKAYLMGVNAGSGTIFPRGLYFDTIVKTSEGWRFQVKHFIQGDSPVPETVPDVFKGKAGPTVTSSR